MTRSSHQPPLLSHRVAIPAAEAVITGHTRRPYRRSVFDLSINGPGGWLLDLPIGLPGFPSRDALLFRNTSEAYAWPEDRTELGRTAEQTGAVEDREVLNRPVP